MGFTRGAVQEVGLSSVVGSALAYPDDSLVDTAPFLVAVFHAAMLVPDGLLARGDCVFLVELLLTGPPFRSIFRF